MDENMEYKLECMKEISGTTSSKNFRQYTIYSNKVLFIPLIALSYILCIGFRNFRKTTTFNYKCYWFCCGCSFNIYCY